MNFNEAMDVVRGGGNATRAVWTGSWVFNGSEGIMFNSESNKCWPYIPSTEDFAATDWSIAATGAAYAEGSGEAG